MLGHDGLDKDQSSPCQVNITWCQCQGMQLGAYWHMNLLERLVVDEVLFGSIVHVVGGTTVDAGESSMC